jgi:8-oxo-dGTP diphosphatase
MSQGAWCVMRQDDNGNRRMVAEALTEPEARLLSASYAARGHKQTYWIEPMASDPASSA